MFESARTRLDPDHIVTTFSPAPFQFLLVSCSGFAACKARLHVRSGGTMLFDFWEREMLELTERTLNVLLLTECFDAFFWFCSQQVSGLSCLEFLSLVKAC